MSNTQDLLSFPYKTEQKEDSLKETNDWREGDEDNGIEAALNVSFLERLEDSTKFSYAGVCAETLYILFGIKEKEYCHEIVTSFVAHLCLPSNVATTMQALADGHGQHATDIFVDALMKDKNIKEDPLLIANDLVMWALTASNGCYDARTRYLIRHMTWKLHIKYEDMEIVEEMLIQMLRESTDKEKSEQEATRLKKARNRKWKRYALIGLATAGGGALIGLTGGLAAPLVAAGAGAILGGASAAALGSVAGIAIITSLFGAAGAGLTGYKMKRRVGGIDEFKFLPLTIAAQPNITIAVSGWLSDDNDSGFVYPWRHLMHSKEQYTLVWESKHLQRLGNAFQEILENLVSVGVTEALKYTVLASLIAAVAWPATLISAAGIIDNPWGVCLQRASQVGKQLAEVLLAREHGHRPVTLIGYSLGARVIYYCLEEMSKRKKHQGIIEDVYLLGAPVSGNPKDWEKFESVVAGHITNAYSRTDWLLKFLYRTSTVQVKVAGLQPVEWENRRMINIDLSSVIDGHLDYAKHMRTVLSAIGVRCQEARSGSGLELRATQSMPSLPAVSTATVTTSMSGSMILKKTAPEDQQPPKDQKNKDEQKKNCSSDNDGLKPLLGTDEESKQKYFQNKDLVPSNVPSEKNGSSDNDDLKTSISSDKTSKQRQPKRTKNKDLLPNVSTGSISNDMQSSKYRKNDKDQTNKDTVGNDDLKPSFSSEKQLEQDHSERRENKDSGQSSISTSTAQEKSTKKNSDRAYDENFQPSQNHSISASPNKESEKKSECIDTENVNPNNAQIISSLATSANHDENKEKDSECADNEKLVSADIEKTSTCKEEDSTGFTLVCSDLDGFEVVDKMT